MGDHLALILAAGLGQRMKSRRPKVLHRVAGLPMVRLVAEAAAAGGARRVLVVVGHGAAEVRQALGGTPVEFVEQREQLGTGHAVMAAAEALAGEQGDLLVLSGDVPLLRAETAGRLLETHRRSRAGCTLLAVRLPDPQGYGRVITGPQGLVERIVEEKDASDEERRIELINVGLYFFPLPLLFEVLAGSGRDNAQGEYYLTDAIAALRRRGLPVVPLVAPDPEEVLGVNTRVELARAGEILNRRKLEQLMLDGVTVVDPRTTCVDWTVQIGRDTIIEPQVVIEGETEIGEGCRIESFCRIADSTLAAGVTVRSFTLLEESRIEKGRTVGPHQAWCAGRLAGPAHPPAAASRTAARRRFPVGGRRE